jgi:hypothetical protein
MEPSRNLIPDIFYIIADILETEEFKKQMTFYTITRKEEFIEVRFYKYINKEVLSYQTVFQPWVIEQAGFQLRTVLELEMKLALKKFMKGR